MGRRVRTYALSGLVAVEVKLVRLVLSLGIESDLQCLCLRCFSAVLGNQTEGTALKAGSLVLELA